MHVASVVLAHQGGWDEMLLVVGPMVVIVALLRLAKRRVEQVERTTQADGAGPDRHAGPDGSDGA